MFLIYTHTFFFYRINTGFSVYKILLYADGTSLLRFRQNILLLSWNALIIVLQDPTYKCYIRQRSSEERIADSLIFLYDNASVSKLSGYDSASYYDIHVEVYFPYYVT